ncbi:hypothetical protein PAPYR_11178 [Paratrimastix pyriformis]|uniref:Uncharacterized protein n=1 Tax=Paratrimastix pyriformis TaxID=342808 RepID=A0ABQ8U657_9EUKA|nr:hypothetical protein PAPYR_11178 [Paratrimastix pyriformis]
MLTSDPSRKAPMTHWLLNSSPDAQTQDRELPELTRWLFCGQGVHAERGECPTSAVRTGVALRGASRGLVTACSFANISAPLLGTLRSCPAWKIGAMYLRGLHVFMPWYVHGVSSMLGRPSAPVCLWTPSTEEAG